MQDRANSSEVELKIGRVQHPALRYALSLGLELEAFSIQGSGLRVMEYLPSKYIQPGA